MSENVNRKRITVMLKKPNPLFEKWLTEWKEDAKNKGSKMERTFAYALSNLRKCTIPLASGQECRIIKGFGEKLCKMIDEKLALYNRTKENISSNIVPKIISVSPQKPGQSFTKEHIPINIVPQVTIVSPQKQRPSSSKGEYIPKYRSGAYAILLALNSNWPDFLRKEEIIQLGKHFSNNSFLKPDPGSRYTAWSSMKTLLEKGLVIKQGRPVKYSLSEKGRNIAETFLEDNTDTNTNKNIISKLNSSEKSPRSISPCNFDIPTVLELPHKKPLPVLSNDVIDLIDDCNEVLEQNELLNKIDNCSVKLKISNHEIELPSIETLKNIIPQSSASSTNSAESGFISSCSSQSSEKSRNTKTVQKFLSADSLSTNKKLSKKSPIKRGLKKCTSSSSVQLTQSSEQEECFIFEPHSFDVILYVDTQETTGSNTDIQDDPLLSKLQNNSVQYEVKHLNIGDYVWICRHRLSKKELVLPYIIERKRLDDFASSIKDGRYHEQKFRLKKSGIQNITYLIENFNQHVSLPLSTLHQAAANTAIQDGFNVKFTANIGHTAKYLASFSRLLDRNYKDKTIVSCPRENLSVVNITDDLISLMAFNEFNKASSKNKPMRVSELFIKMLLQIKGMSVEKACAIVDRYPLPRMLKETYDKNTPAQGEKLLAKIAFGKYQKNIGAVLSKTVYDLFTKEKF